MADAEVIDWSRSGEYLKGLVEARLGGLLDRPVNLAWARVFGRYCTEAHLWQWDDARVAVALGEMEHDPEATYRTLTILQSELAQGLHAVFVTPSVVANGGALAAGMVAQSTALHLDILPEYLRLCQGALTPLLRLLLVARLGPKYQRISDLKPILAGCQKAGFAQLADGANERIRNAAAHGQAYFRGDSIVLGEPSSGAEITQQEIIGSLDALRESVNAIALALTLFVFRNQSSAARILPLPVIALIAEGALDTAFASITAALESRRVDGSRQLIIGLRTKLYSRSAVAHACLVVARELARGSLTGFNEIQFEIDYGRSVKGLLILDVDQLKQCLRRGDPLEGYALAVIGTPLLWYDEGAWRQRIRVWWMIVRSHFRTARAAGEFPIPGWSVRPRFVVLESSDVSTGWRGRVRLSVALMSGGHAPSKEDLVPVVVAAIERARRERCRTALGDLGDRLRFRWFVTHAMVHVYRRPSVPSIRRNGWTSGQLLAVGEWRSVFTPWYVRTSVKNPQKRVDRVEMRFELDKLLLAQALEGLAPLVRKPMSSQG